MAELGATVLGDYVDTKTPVLARCAAGHDCKPSPGSVQAGNGICSVCARNDSAAAEATFRARLVELGATPLYEKWVGTNHPHDVRCVNGHNCAPRPGWVNQGRGICRTCAGLDPAVAEANFRARLAELGATPLYEKWLGKDKRHHVRCANGHDCYVRPSCVRKGQGVCITCAGCDPAVAKAAFHARMTELGATILGNYVDCKTPVPGALRRGPRLQAITGQRAAGRGDLHNVRRERSCCRRG